MMSNAGSGLRSGSTPATTNPWRKSLLEEPASYGWSTTFRAHEFSQIDFEWLLYYVGEKTGKIHTATRGFVQFGADDVKALGFHRFQNSQKSLNISMCYARFLSARRSIELSSYDVDFTKQNHSDRLPVLVVQVVVLLVS